MDIKETPPCQLASVASGAPTSTNLEGRNNNFNFLRLALATMVILSHSPLLVDGNEQREPLKRISGALPLGEVAVSAFFLLSGFLIVQSWSRTPLFFDFLKKRVLRIYPGFVGASLVSALVVGPLGSNTSSYFSQFDWIQFLKGVLVLHTPLIPRVFEGQPFSMVNGSMWTIIYEFRCYLLVALFGLCGFIKRRHLWLALSVVTLLFFLSSSLVNHTTSPLLRKVLGNPVVFLRFAVFFCVGGCFSLFRDRIQYKASWACAAGVLLLACFFYGNTARLSLMTLGAYVLFWFAFAHIPALTKWRTYPDISYGVYLYGWPIQKLWLWHIPSLSPWTLFLLSFPLSYVCGWLSWHLVERPFLRLKPRPLGTVA